MKIQVQHPNDNAIQTLRVDDSLNAALQSKDTYCIETDCFNTLLSLKETSQYLHESKNIFEFRHRYRLINELIEQNYSLVKDDSKLPILGSNVSDHIHKLAQDYPNLRKLYEHVKTSSLEYEMIGATLIKALEDDDPAVALNSATAFKNYISNAEPAQNLITAEIVVRLSQKIASSDTALSNMCFEAVLSAINQYPQHITDACVKIWMKKMSQTEDVALSQKYVSLLDRAIKAKHKKSPIAYEPQTATVKALLKQITNENRVNDTCVRVLRAIAKDYSVFQPAQIRQLVTGSQSDKPKVSRGCMDSLVELGKKSPELFDSALCTSIAKNLMSKDEYVFATTVTTLANVDSTSLTASHVQHLLLILEYGDEQEFEVAAKAMRNLSKLKASPLITADVVDGVAQIFVTGKFRDTLGHILILLQESLDAFASHPHDEVREQVIIARKQIHNALIQYYTNTIIPQFTNMSLPTAAGMDTNIADFLDFESADYTLVVFWATWCEPCVKEIPYLNHFQTQLKQIQIKAIAVNTPADLTAAKLNQLPFLPDYQFLADKEGKLRHLMNVSSIPQIFVFDNKGQFVGKLDKQGEPLNKGDVVKDNPLLDEFNTLIQNQLHLDD